MSREKEIERENGTDKEKCPDETPETGDESAWSEDQQKKSYYYDDSHGYEVYVPDDDE